MKRKHRKIITITVSEELGDCDCESVIYINDDAIPPEDGEACDGLYMYEDARLAAEERAAYYRRRGYKTRIVHASHLPAQD